VDFFRLHPNELVSTANVRLLGQHTMVSRDMEYKMIGLEVSGAAISAVPQRSRRQPAGIARSPLDTTPPQTSARGDTTRDVVLTALRKFRAMSNEALTRTIDKDIFLSREIQKKWHKVSQEMRVL
jgi:hypothetical protein